MSFGILHATVPSMTPAAGLDSPFVAAKEALLIRKIREGQRSLFGELITPHLRSLCSFLNRSGNRREDFEDIAQQVALKAFIHLEQFRSEASFRTWLFRIALNEARQFRRRMLGSEFVSLEQPCAQVALRDEKRSPFSECHRNEVSRMLRDAAAALPKKYRVVFSMFFFELLSVAEVARRLQMPISTVKTRLSRARKALGKVVAKRYHGQRERGGPPSSS